jgi:hypothetical protein
LLWISTFLGKLRFLESIPPFFVVEDLCEWAATYFVWGDVVALRVVIARRWSLSKYKGLSLLLLWLLVLVMRDVVFQQALVACWSNTKRPSLSQTWTTESTTWYQK